MNARIAEKTRANTVLHHIIICPPNKGGKTSINIGGVFGASYEVSIEISKIVPIFLVSLPFVAITRIATAGFYATEKSGLSYILTFIEPVLIVGKQKKI